MGGTATVAIPPAAPTTVLAQSPVPPRQVVLAMDLDTLGSPRTPDKAIDRLLLARSRMNDTIQHAFKELRGTSTTDVTAAPSQGGSKLGDIEEGIRPNKIAWGQSSQDPRKASKLSRKNHLKTAGLRLQGDIRTAVTEAALP